MIRTTCSFFRFVNRRNNELNGESEKNQSPIFIDGTWNYVTGVFSIEIYVDGSLNFRYCSRRNLIILGNLQEQWKLLLTRAIR